MFFSDCILEVVLLTVTLLMAPAQSEFNPMLDESYPYINDYHRNVVHFNCVKMKGCVGNSVKICGYDDLDNELADFDELCTLYKVNCHYKRGFRQVDVAVCEARKLADVQYPTKNATRGNTNIEGNNTDTGTEIFSPSFGYFDWEEEKTLEYQKKITQKQEEAQQHNQKEEEGNISDNMQENQNKEGQKQDDQKSEIKKQKHQIPEGKEQDELEKDNTFKKLRMALMDIARRSR